jgi:hypothetical protein
VKAVSKRIYREGTREYGAKSEEATEMRSQQECILSGGVYLRHRLEKQYLPFHSDTLYHNNEGRARLAFWRAGVQETVPLFD